MNSKPTAGKPVVCFVAALIWSMPLWNSLINWDFGWLDLLPLALTGGFIAAGIVTLRQYLKEK